MVFFVRSFVFEGLLARFCSNYTEEEAVLGSFFFRFPHRCLFFSLCKNGGTKKKLWVLLLTHSLCLHSFTPSQTFTFCFWAFLLIWFAIVVFRFLLCYFAHRKNMCTKTGCSWTLTVFDFDGFELLIDLRLNCKPMDQPENLVNG